MIQPAIDSLSAGSTGAPYVMANFAPLMNEVTAFDLEVVGRIPETLNGRFLRIGPNPVDEPDPLWLGQYHWFAGAGMAHGLRLHDGKAEWFRSRFVIDRHTAEVRRAKPIGGPGEGTRDTSVNTNFTVVGGKLCAIVEAGNLPVELDYELESIRRTDFDGTLEAGFSGHPKFDPVTGEQHVLAYEPFQPVRYISVGRDGRATTKARIDLPHIPMIHDMAFTASFIIVPDLGHLPARTGAHKIPVDLGRSPAVPHRSAAARRRRHAPAVVRDAAVLRLPLRQRL